ncbi:hypothetical protein BD779DRAFT_1705403 [Infundibulicybe gibba]|nr:hypothetical protein BD779DRAFT_1705403 [Infundibulicybe gibba]
MSSSSTPKNYGVQYSPSNTSAPIVSVESLEGLGIKYIRVQWVDFSNNIRYRVLPLAYFMKIVYSERPSISIAKVALGLVFLTMAEGFKPIGEYLYVPDLTSIRICTYAPGHASIMGYFEEKVLVDRGQSLKVDLCPRTTLLRVVSDAKRNLGVDFLVGVESEFILLKSVSPLEAVNEHGWSNAQALSTGTLETQAMQEIADALQEAGIELQMYHAEAAPGQYEVVTGPMAPLAAADALIFTRETIYNIATKHGLHATFAPRIYASSAGTAAHTHISVHSSEPTERSEQSPYLNNVEASFLSGVLDNLPALCLLNLPLPASYSRVVDGAWSGGTYVCWGTDNREAPVRLCNATSPKSRNFELKSIDGTSNPYLALAGILGAGSLGIERNAKLTQRDCSGELSAAELGESARAELGITQRLPLNWEDSWKTFSNDATVQEIFGANFVTKYSSVNQASFLSACYGWLFSDLVAMLQTLAAALTRSDLTEAQAQKLLIEHY